MALAAEVGRLRVPDRRDGHVTPGRDRPPPRHPRLPSYREHSMPTDPQPVTLAQLVHRAVQTCDPDGSDDALSDLLHRFEDSEEPVGAVADVEQRMAEATGAIEPDGALPSLLMASAIVVYLAHRRDELDAPRETLLSLAARAEFGGHPPAHVSQWLEAEGVAV